MTRLERIELERQSILSEQRNCCHDWNEPRYDPETVSEGYGYKTIVQGSDIWSDYEGYRNVQKDRWSRKCKKCEKIEYTYKQGTKTITTGPQF